MKQFHLEVKENEEPDRGRKVFDQTIYVSALERGTRDRSPRRVEPLLDRIEFKICPQKNHRGRMNYYRTRSIPELCRITLTPTGETSHQQGRMEEVYITQYTHSFDREIEKPHVVAWKRAFEDSDVCHRDSKLCIVNSPVGSKTGGYPERRKSAPPGSFVFNYDTLDMPEPVHRRSMSLGTNMNDLIDFDNIDTQVGTSAGGNIDLEMEKSYGGKMDLVVRENTDGKMRPLVHEMISAQKQEQVESVDSSFWENDAFNSFDAGENCNSTASDVRNGDTMVDGITANGVTTSYVRSGHVKSGHVTAGDPTIDDVSNGVTTSYIRSGDVTADDVSPNDFNSRCDEITHDSREHNMQDPTKQALSLINTLRSTVKKPDSQKFLRSVHEPPTSKTISESTGKNRLPQKSRSKEPIPQKFPEQGVSYQSRVPLGTLSSREHPQKVTSRIVFNLRSESTYQTVRQHEVLSQRPVLPEKKSRKKLPQEMMPRKMAPQEDLSQEDLPQEIDAQVENKLKAGPELERKYTSKTGANPAKTSHSTTKLSRVDQFRNHPKMVAKKEAQMSREYGPVKTKYISKYETSTTDSNDPTSKPNYSYPDIKSDDKGILSRHKTDADPERVSTSHFFHLKKQTSSELKDTSYEPYENAEMKTSHFVPSKRVSDEDHHIHRSSEFTSENARTDKNEDYYQEPKLILNTMERSETNYSIPTKHFENSQPSSAINMTSKQVTDGQNEDYQEPDREARRKGTVKTNQSTSPTQPQSAESPTSERVTTQQYEEYYQQPNLEGKTLETVNAQSDGFEEDSNTVVNVNSISSVFPEKEGNQTLTEDYYQNVDIRMKESVGTNYSVHGSTVFGEDYRNTSDILPEDYYQSPNSLVEKINSSETNQESLPKQFEETVYTTTDQERNYSNEDYYQQPNSKVKTSKTVEVNQSSHSQPDTVYNKKQAMNNAQQSTLEQEEDYYQQPSSEVRTLKTVEVNQRFRSKQDIVYNQKWALNNTSQQPKLEQEEDYYQQPNIRVRKMESETKPLRYGVDTRHNNGSKITGKMSEPHIPQQDEHYYQQPTFDLKTLSAPTLRTEFKTKGDLYEKPKHSTPSLQKCPLDQTDMQRNDKDYRQPLPEVPTQRKTSESHYEIPVDTNPSSAKCPIDETDAEKDITGDYFGQSVEHIYEQPNFATERVYEQFDYEKMKAPHSKLPDWTSWKITDSEKDIVYEQPDRKVYENVEGVIDRKHLDSKMRYKVVKTQQLKNTPDIMYEQPSMTQENTTRSQTQVPEILHTVHAKNDETKQIVDSSYTVSTTKTADHNDSVNPRYKQTDNQQFSVLSLRSTNDLKKDFQNSDQSSRVTYGGKVNTKKSVVSTTSSVGHNQSDDRISDNSPKSQSTSFEGELLPQKPEAEVWESTTRVKPKNVNAKKKQDEEFSPSTYSKANSGNTSLARFSSFNSEASYKRRLTSAWIEQQRMNFRKNVSREPSLRRTKSVEFHKERTAPEDNADYKLKHSKSELSLEQLDAMYEPFDDKYFDTNPNKHPVKVVHASPSEVFTKTKSMERRVEKAREPKYFLQENTPTNTEILTRSPEGNAKDGSSENRNMYREGNISRQDRLVTNNEVKPWREPFTSSQKHEVRPKSADISEFDIKTYDDETERLWVRENAHRQDLKTSCGVESGSNQRSIPRPKSTDISGFDVTRFNDKAKDVSMGENNGELANNTTKPNSVQKSRMRPKSADVSGFDITSYNNGPQNGPRQENDSELANKTKPSSHQRSRVRPKSADVSAFDITTYNDEPTLKYSKSEVSVDQLKAMYDPYDQNSWFSPDPASENVNQSNTVQVEATVHEVVHRRTRSEPESRSDRLKSGRKVEQTEPQISKAEIRGLETETVKNITKLDSSSVLLLNVVKVEENGQPKNSKFMRNVSRKSTSNIVSVTASEIENEKHLTTAESKGRELTRNIQQNKTIVAGTKSTTDQTTQNGKPIEKLRAHYVSGGERASVRYLSKSTDELTSNDNETPNETLPQLQGKPNEKPAKAPKKDGRFLNFFGRLRRSKSEPNLDKNFNILDIDSDHGGKKENSQKLKEVEKNFNETSPRNSKEKSQSGGLKTSFYPKLKNLTKNFSKSRQNKTDGSFHDSGVDSGKDTSRSQEFLETSVVSESDVKRENVELAESQADGDRSQNIESKIIDSPISSQSVNSVKSDQYHVSKSEIRELFVQVQQRPPSEDKETKLISASSPVTSPRSGRKRFFQGGNRVKPVTDSEDNLGATHGNTTSNIVVTSQESLSDHRTITTEESQERHRRMIHTSLPPTPTDNHQDRITETTVTRSVNDTTLNSTPVRFQVDSNSPKDKTQLPSTSKENIDRNAEERTTRYRVTEVTSQRKTVSDGNNSRFIIRGEHSKSTDQSNSDSVITYKNNTGKIVKITHQGGDGKNHDVNSKFEEPNSTEREDSEITKTKHRSFFKTKISTSSRKVNTSEGRNSPERKGKKEEVKEHEVAQEIENLTTEGDSQDSMVIKDNTLDNSNQVLKEANDTTSNSSKEIAKTREVLRERKKVKNSSQTSKDKEDKEKSEFGTKIKGFITKVLPQKDKSSSKENIVKEVPGNATVSKSEGSSDENNPTATSSNDESKDGQKQSNTSVSTKTKSRRSIFVAKHLGESDTEKARTSEEEGIEVRVATKELNTSHPNKNERRTGYISKVKHMGDHKAVNTEIFESEKQSSKRFSTLETNETHAVQRNLRENEDRNMNSRRSFPNRDAFQPKDVQDETITKTEAVNNLEAFDSVLEFFDNEFNGDESKDGMMYSLPKPDKQEKTEEFGKASSGLMISSNTVEHERNIRVAKENESKVRRHKNQFVRDDRVNGLKDSGGRASTTRVHTSTTDAKRKEISSNVHTKGDTTEYVKKTTDNEKQRNLEQIKGFTIKHSKTSSLVLNKSIEDDLDNVGKDDDESVPENFKHQELNTNKGNDITLLSNMALYYRSVQYLVETS